MVLKVVAFVLSLGIDTLVVSTSLGARQRSGLVRTALAFATAEAVMPLLGVLVGRGAGRLVGVWAGLAGGVLLCLLAVWMIFLEHEADDDDDLDEGEGRAEDPGARRAGPAGWALLTAALSVSIDELAAGFSIGMVGVPAFLTVALVACQSFVFTLVGLRFGQRLRPLLGERAERVAGAVLGLLGLWIIVEGLPHL